MKMAVDERRRNKEPSGVDGLARLRCDLGPDLDDAPVRDADVDACAPVGQSGVTDKKVEHQRAFFRMKVAGKNVGRSSSEYGSNLDGRRRAMQASLADTLWANNNKRP